MRDMHDLIVVWTEDDGTRCVLSGDEDRLLFSVIEANGQVTHSSRLLTCCTH